jgi:anaerobic selenocysteine-containing dehydrogenase
VIGSNPTSNHPVAATWMKNAAQRGTRIVLADPRITDIGRHTWRTLQFKADTDVALLNAMLHVIVTENLCDETFLRERADNVAELKAHVQNFTPEAMSAVCGIPADTIREVARAYATALPDRAGQHHWPDRPPRHRPAPIARSEQRSGRKRRGPDSDDVPQLPAGRRQISARLV